jgi:outer membrane protein OmpA-like peptidoglycan-associated protein
MPSAITKNAALALLSAATLLLAGCAQQTYFARQVDCACEKKSYVVLIPSPDGTTGAVIVKGEQGGQLIQTAGQGAPVDGSAKPAPVDKAQLERDFGAAMAARPEIPVRYLLYFETGSTQLTPESQALVEKMIADTGKWPALDVSVVGHTDTVGKEKLNDELSLKRAQSVADLLKSKGLKVQALSIESYGKRNLLVQTPDNTPELKNRRVEVTVR